MWKGPKYDCQECGACCVYQGPTSGAAYVYLRKDEAKRMGRLGLTVVQTSGNSYLGTRSHRGADGRPACVALKGQVGGLCQCSIYSDRPSACRAFEVGEEFCLKAREQAGLPI